MKSLVIWCGKVFTQNSHAKTHYKLMHTNEKPFQCRVCPYRTKTQQHLEMHKEAKHELIKYVCNKCERKFAQKSHVKMHYRKMHAEEGSSMEKCTYYTIQKQNIVWFGLKEEWWSSNLKIFGWCTLLRAL